MTARDGAAGKRVIAGFGQGAHGLPVSGQRAAHRDEPLGTGGEPDPPVPEGDQMTDCPLPTESGRTRGRSVSVTGRRSRRLSLSPTCTRRRAHSPADSSSTARAWRREATRHGRNRSTMSTTYRSLSRKSASIAKRMKAV